MVMRSVGYGDKNQLASGGICHAATPRSFREYLIERMLLDFIRRRNSSRFLPALPHGQVAQQIIEPGVFESEAVHAAPAIFRRVKIRRQLQALDTSSR